MQNLWSFKPGFRMMVGENRNNKKRNLDGYIAVAILLFIDRIRIS